MLNFNYQICSQASSAVLMDRMLPERDVQIASQLRICLLISCRSSALSFLGFLRLYFQRKLFFCESRQLQFKSPVWYVGVRKSKSHVADHLLQWVVPISSRGGSSLLRGLYIGHQAQLWTHPSKSVTFSDTRLSRNLIFFRYSAPS